MSPFCLGKLVVYFGSSAPTLKEEGSLDVPGQLYVTQAFVKRYAGKTLQCTFNKTRPTPISGGSNYPGMVQVCPAMPDQLA